MLLLIMRLLIIVLETSMFIMKIENYDNINDNDITTARATEKC